VKEFDPNHPDILRLGDEPKPVKADVELDAEDTPENDQ
jgi:hypothetical protein